jgi:hypothetical protein
MRLILFITNMRMVRNLSGLGLDISFCPKKLYCISFRDVSIFLVFTFSLSRFSLIYLRPYTVMRKGLNLFNTLFGKQQT